MHTIYAFKERSDAEVYTEPVEVRKRIQQLYNIDTKLFVITSFSTYI